VVRRTPHAPRDEEAAVTVVAPYMGLTAPERWYYPAITGGSTAAMV